MHRSTTTAHITAARLFSTEHSLRANAKSLSTHLSQPAMSIRWACACLPLSRLSLRALGAAPVPHTAQPPIVKRRKSEWLAAVQARAPMAGMVGTGCPGNSNTKPSTLERSRTMQAIFAQRADTQNTRRTGRPSPCGPGHWTLDTG